MSRLVDFGIFVFMYLLIYIVCKKKSIHVYSPEFSTASALEISDMPASDPDTVIVLACVYDAAAVVRTPR